MRAPNLARMLLRSPRGLTVGSGSSVHPTVVDENADVVVGAKTRLQRGVFIRGPQVRIGNRVFCNDGVYINHHVTIEDEVSIGQFTRLITGGHDLGPEGHRAGRPADGLTAGSGSGGRSATHYAARRRR